MQAVWYSCFTQEDNCPGGLQSGYSVLHIREWVILSTNRPLPADNAFSTRHQLAYPCDAISIVPMAMNLNPSVVATDCCDETLEDIASKQYRWSPVIKSSLESDPATGKTADWVRLLTENATG